MEVSIISSSIGGIVGGGASGVGAFAGFGAGASAYTLVTGTKLLEFGTNEQARTTCP